MNSRFDIESLATFCRIQDKCCFQEGKDMGKKLATSAAERQQQGLKQELELLKLTSGLQNVVLHEKNQELSLRNTKQNLALKQETKHLLILEQLQKDMKLLKETIKKQDERNKKQDERNKKQDERNKKQDETIKELIQTSKELKQTSKELKEMNTKLGNRIKRFEDLILTDKLLLLIKELYPGTDPTLRNAAAHVDNIKRRYHSMSHEQKLQFMRKAKTALEGNLPTDDVQFIEILFELEDQEKNYVLAMIDNIVDELEK